MKICIVPECGNLVEGNTHRCASHNQMARRKERERKKEAQKRDKLLLVRCETTIATYKLAKTKKAIKKVSDKRKELNKEYAILRHQYLLEHPDCEVKLIGCEGASVEIHHTYSGSNKVAHLNDTATWKATCANCHRILHDKLSAKEARELGLKI